MHMDEFFLGQQWNGSGFFVCEQYHFLVRRVADSGEFFIYSDFTSFSPPLKKKKTGGFPWQSTLHNAASQHATHSLNTVNNSALIHVPVGQNKNSAWHLKDTLNLKDAIHST